MLYAQEQPHAAIGHHLACVRAISEGAIKDLNFRFSVYYNLGNDYLSGNDMAHAIGSYKRALRVLKDLDAPERAADIYWGLTHAYRAQGKTRDARLCAARAIQVYQVAGNRPTEAAMQINLAEVLIDEGRDEEAARALEAASALLADTGNHGVLSYLHRYYADLARRAGELDRAARFAEESIRNARELAEQGQEDERYVWIETIRTLAEAFHAAALIEEARGNIEEADLLFKKSIEEIERTTVEVVKRAISQLRRSVGSQGVL